VVGGGFGPAPDIENRSSGISFRSASVECATHPAFAKTEHITVSSMHAPGQSGTYEGKAKNPRIRHSTCIHSRVALDGVVGFSQHQIQG
jgi:hypothetical protein